MTITKYRATVIGPSVTKIEVERETDNFVICSNGVKEAKIQKDYCWVTDTNDQAIQALKKYFQAKVEEYAGRTAYYKDKLEKCEQLC